MSYYRIQPAEFVDHITEDGTELTRLPYPIVADEGGMVSGRADIGQVIGFVADLHRQEVDLSWHAMQRPGDDPTGMYVIVSDHDGQWCTLAHAVKTFERLS